MPGLENINPEENTDTYLKGRGAQINTKNRFLKMKQQGNILKVSMIGPKPMKPRNT
jgi:hypothetical protein